MKFVHCFKCGVAVTPSGRRVVDMVNGEILLVPMPREALERLCRMAQHWKVEGDC